ncbi:MAG: tRNA lysidine(34) synthetase TilS [Deltaproteobacteria bacterium]|jgi:tRNA(Ile)-lysidine synthase|nr:tRNA lysidine(34) synthetase TilS [Deltaproteobacteria bacterium]
MSQAEKRKSPALPERFEAAMAELCPGWPEGRYLCAFSGGSDSLALLSLLADRLPPENLLAAHLDHGLRESSAAEAVEASRAAASLGVACLVERRDVPGLAQRRGKGLEEAARRARYDFLAQRLEAWGGDWIVTGHQAEDLLETVLLKLVRGAGPGALAGIPAKNGRIVRPLLAVRRRQLQERLESRGLSWLEDLSNGDERFSRNLVRLRVLPALESLNGACLEAVGRLAKLAASEEEFWDGRLDELCDRLVVPLEGDRFRLEAAGLMALTLAERRRLVVRLLRRVERPGAAGGAPVSFLSVDMLLDFVGRPGAGGLDLPGGRRVEWRGPYLLVGPASRFFAAKPDGPS